MAENAENSNNLKTSNANLTSRLVYERIKGLEKPPKHNKVATEGNKQLSTTMGTVIAMTAEAALSRYKYYFKEKLRLKTTPVMTIADIDKVNDQIYKIGDKIWDAKRQYEKLAVGVDPEEELLRTRIFARKELYNITTPDLPRANETIETATVLSFPDNEKEKEEIITHEDSGLLNSAMKGGTEEDYMKELRLQIKKENPELSDDIIEDLIGAE